MKLIDTHLHLVYQDRLSYPWLENAPALNRQWDAPTYFAEAEPLGIETVLHMEVDVADADRVAETDMVLALDPRIVGAIAACRPEHPAFGDEIERLAENPGVRGVRRVLHVMPDDLSQSDLFVENIRILSDFDLSFDLCLRANQLAIGQQLVERAPNVEFILDHCGGPDIAGDGYAPWAKAITAIAKSPNLYAKVSGIVASAKPDWTAADLRPYFEHIIASFGWDRVVWGSDFPVCTLNGGLTRWVEATHELLASCSNDEKSRLLHINAISIYKI